MSRALHTRLKLGVPATIFIAWFLAGAAIFALPELFYKVVPGVKLFGPFNAHFIQDVGLVYLASGVIGLYGLRSGSAELCIAGALWSCLHGLFHLHLWWHRGFPVDGIFLFDLGFVILPPFLVLVPVTLGLLRRGTRS
jgi:hypothetical protein